MKTKELLKTNKYQLLLIALIIIQLLRVVYVFNFEKEGYHSDEIWCYGLANSYYDPFIFLNGSCFDTDDYEKRHNFNEWLDGDVYRDYIEVGDNDRFAYDSVIYNQSKDQLPPLHYIVLHTICSMFPNTFSMWYGLSINLCMLILTNVFLYLLARKLLVNKYQALLTVGFYGFGIGALQTFMYIRMYAMVTMFVVLITYIHARMFLDLKYNIKTWVALMIITLLGGLTHYVFLFYAFFLAAFICFYYLFSKRIKRLLFYSTAMLAGVGGVLLIFPYAIEQLFGNRAENAGRIPTRLEIAYVINRTFMENTGIYIDIYRSLKFLYIGAILFLVLLFVLATLFICRNEEWLKILKTSIKSELADAFLKKWQLKNRRVFFILVLFVATSAEIIVAAYICNVVVMGLLSNRYLFCAYPCFCILFLAFTFMLIRKCVISNRTKNVIMLLLVVIFMLMSNLSNENQYLFPRSITGKTISEVAKDSDILLAVSEDWLLVTYPDKLLDCNKVMNVNLAEYEEFPEIVGGLPNDGKDVYLVLDVSVIEAEKQYREEDNSEFMGLETPTGTGFKREVELDYSFDDVVDKIAKIDGVKSFDMVGSEIIFGRRNIIYKLR